MQITNSIVCDASKGCIYTLMEIKGFSQCIANKLAAAASCGMVAACEFFVCKIVLLLLVAASLQLLVAATLRLFELQQPCGS